MPYDSQAELKVLLPPDPPSVAQARHAVRGLADRCGAEADDVALPVSEAVTNRSFTPRQDDASQSSLSRRSATGF